MLAGLLGYRGALQVPAQQVRRHLLSSFSYAGPRSLDEILKTEMVQDKSKEEVEHLWLQYHHDKDREGIIGMTVNGEEMKLMLKRAKDCPIFIQPIFRENGFFNLLTQFQDPRYFLCCYLEDFQSNPASTINPLLTISLFDDMVEDRDLGLIRADVVNKGITEGQATKIVELLTQEYKQHFQDVSIFNKDPANFDFDDYISRQRPKWK